MNKIVPVVIAVAFVFSLAGMTSSAERQQKKLFAGTIKKIDTKEKVITLENDRVAEFTCSVDEKSIPQMTNGKKTLADMKVGDIAVVVYEEVNGKNVAKGITVQPPPMTASPKQKNEPADTGGKK